MNFDADVGDHQVITRAGHVPEGKAYDSTDVLVADLDLPE